VVNPVYAVVQAGAAIATAARKAIEKDGSLGQPEHDGRQFQARQIRSFMPVFVALWEICGAMVY
jgi:hypothetical protein